MQLEKITNSRPNEPKRSYDDACGTAHALELIGERWALLVLRELMLGPRRFSQLRADLPGISANVLTQRLGELEERGLVVRRRLPPPADVRVYEATEWGLEVEPILQALGRWATRSPRHDPSLPVSAVSIMMSFRTMFDPKGAKGMDARIGFRFGDDSYVVRVKKARIKVSRAADRLTDCDLVITAAPEAVAAVVYGKQPHSGLITVDGDDKLLRRFVDLFHLPPKAMIPGY